MALQVFILMSVSTCRPYTLLKIGVGYKSNKYVVLLQYSPHNLVRLARHIFTQLTGVPN